MSVGVGVDVNVSVDVGVIVDEGVGVWGVTCVSVVQGCRGWRWILHGCWWAAVTDTGWRRRRV